MSPPTESIRHPLRHYLGAPVSVGLVAPLSRMPDSDGADRIVAAARQVFGEEGRVEEGPGGFRWSTPRAAVEVVRPELDPDRPGTDSGASLPRAELRAGVHLQSGELLPLLGVVVLGLNTVAGVISVSGWGPEPASMLPVVAANALLGTVLFVAGQVRARRWSQEAREKLDRMLRDAGVVPPGGMPG